VTAHRPGVEVIHHPADSAEAGSRGAGLALRGALTADTVPGLWKQLSRFFNASREPLAIDLAGITSVDSAGLALLVTWAGRAAQSELPLSYIALPERLLRLARISEVDELIS
jgi:ABC-type transporter Mla MlaB component